ncbi:type II toxin-antitoxin system RelE/ParE family toxin [Massilia sp. erpn]|uniref:type II toxin-antitoxin system RelE/ParE family toxin n=1 Tax=Massilia sp. erpn TaxID=2738142 RepID=UPI002101D95B|nr:type II toxin-antitoxin system RelE/ParE family toxin [Massilia sp. erpn]UTY58359.1 type II toxin-antitoxin system RelE/ParE family toxin [Massilia sp. erpn]
MSGLIWLESAKVDIGNIFDFLAQRNPTLATSRVKSINSALEILKQAPQLGRPVKNGKRELIVGPRHATYIAVYFYEKRTDTVFILEIRSQRQLPSS